MQGLAGYRIALAVRKLGFLGTVLAQAQDASRQGCGTHERTPGRRHRQVESGNVGAPRAVQVNGHTVLTALWKRRVPGAGPLRGVNLLGDDQADRTVHGGPGKAVYT